MLGERKSEIFDIIPEEYIPKTIKILPNTSFEEVSTKCLKKGIEFPFICKPDIGERGWMVKKINDAGDLKEYLSQIKVDYLVQEYVEHSLELGIFYYRSPHEEKGTISSIVVKEMLFVEGNGNDTLIKLIKNKPRARFQLDELTKIYDHGAMSKVLPIGEKFELVSIGNHSLGTKFLDGVDWIDEQLTNAMDILSKKIPEFYFGRFDLRCKDIESLKKLEDFKIMELNGAGSEPAHIYQPGFSLFKAYGVLFHHLKVLSKISSLNKKRGFPYWSTKQGLAKIKEIRDDNREKD